MAHFYGTIQGSRGRASRLGHRTDGLTTTAASYEGAVQVYLYERDGVDFAAVSLMKWRGAGTERVLYDGPVSGALIVRGKDGKPVWKANRK